MTFVPKTCQPLGGSMKHSTIFKFASIVLGVLVAPVTFAGETSAATPARYTTHNYGVARAMGLVRDQKSHEFMATAPHRSFRAVAAVIPGKYSLKHKAG